MINQFWTSPEKKFQEIDTSLPYRERLYLFFQSNFGEIDTFIAFCAIDNFRLVNEAYGREVGDSALESAWKNLIAKLPEDGIAARLSGDGFIVAFPYTESEPYRVVQLLSSKLQYREINSLTWSIGCALLPAPSSLVHWRSAFEQVDRALNEAKKRGGNIALLFKGIADFLVIATGTPSRYIYSNGSRRMR